MSDLPIARIKDRDAFSSSVSADVWHDQPQDKAYEWWYFDALSDDGREALLITFSDNYVFSPRYASVSTESAVPRRFPAVSFLFVKDGKTVFRSVNEFTSRQFQASRETPGCTMGENSFYVDKASYGSGYMLNIDLPVTPGRRLRAKFEWLSIESDLLEQAPESSDIRRGWNIPATRSDVSGKIELVGRRGTVRKLFHFRGTGYHDHLHGYRPLYETVASRQWGRAHYVDTTAIYCIEQAPDEEPAAKLVVVRDGELHERQVSYEAQRFRRDKLGIKYPTRLSLLSDDNIRLRIKPLRIVDSSFYSVRALGEMTLMLRDGKPRKTTGISEYLAPRNIRFRLFRWFTYLKIGRNGKGPLF